MQKFTHQLPKDDLKKFAKEVGKKLVASDFKNKRVEDPTKISQKQEKKVKKYVREYFQKAVEKKKAIEKQKKENAAAHASNDKVAGVNGDGAVKADHLNGEKHESEAELVKEETDVEMSDDDEEKDPFTETPSYTETSDLKRKREGSDIGTPGEDVDSNKRQKEEDESPVNISPPPPPPPPPADSMPLNLLMDGSHDGRMLVEQVREETEEEKELRRQEEDLMRENEEALMMDMDGSLKAEENLHSHNSVDEMHSSNGLPKREGVLSN
jgi:histone-lysine N-methyltransferase SETD2